MGVHVSLLKKKKATDTEYLLVHVFVGIKKERATDGLERGEIVN